ncbi:transcription antitermination factor NusB [Pseudoclavibacter sp. CFCC 11306]|nr:transcription antitermination factor NusB [Pseudoclavibacter sp. CFCC 11306]
MAVTDQTEDSTRRPFSGRTLARQRAVDVLYAADLRGQSVAEAIEAWLSNARDNLANSRPQSESAGLRQLEAERELDHLDTYTYARQIAAGVGDHQSSIDELIESYAKDWTLARLPKVDLAILRVGVWEVLYNDEVPAAVAISEASKLAAELSTDSSPRFVSGVLHAIAEAE